MTSCLQPPRAVVESGSPQESEAPRSPEHESQPTTRRHLHDDEQFANNRRNVGFREHIHQRCSFANAKCPQQARRHRPGPCREEGEQSSQNTLNWLSISHDTSVGFTWVHSPCRSRNMANCSDPTSQERMLTPHSTSRRKWTTSSPCSDDT